jgi:hypothetical protein
VGESEEEGGEIEKIEPVNGGDEKGQAREQAEREHDGSLVSHPAGEHPERMTESPYPAERNVKMALAFAWLTANSSSTRGRIGEKTMRMEKLTNQTKSRKKRKARALPRNSSNRAIHSM